MKNIFKIASLLAAAVMLFACEEMTGGPDGGDGNDNGNGNELNVVSGGLEMTTDKDVIQANGQDAATLRVLYNGQDVTAESFIYDENDDEVVLVDGKFTATEPGEYKFYADYGTFSMKPKADNAYEYFVVKAISVAVPDAVADPQQESTAFVHRTFLAQYTGTGCQYCPLMVKVLRELVARDGVSEKVVHTAVHSFGSGDPAYIAAPKTSNYPYLTLDLVQGYSAEQGTDYLQSLVESHTEGTAKAGISVSPMYYADEKTIVARVSVKAAADGIFNVGAWLLEDEIYGQQTVYDQYKVFVDESYNEHENCVRIADSKYKGTWFGHELGELKAGETAEKTFVMNVKKDWKVENLHLAVFVSYGEKDGSKIAYTVCNAVDAPIDAPTPFEYVK